MSMTYTTLISPKGTSGSIANWVGYSKLDIPTVLDESQTLLFSMLRVREMRTEWTFGVGVNQSEVALPARFLDPDGPIHVINQGLEIDMRPEQDVKRQRFFDNSLSGSFDPDPVTTVSGSSTVTIKKTGHNLSQGSSVTMSGLNAVGGVTVNGTWLVDTVIDASTYTFLFTSNATSSATGGGALGTYTANKLITGTPSIFSVWDEKVKFDTAFDTLSTCQMIYFRAPKLLSADNPSNWLTNRYPKLLRAAFNAAAADFMKDDTEYNKALQALQALIERTGVEGDLMYRGMSFGTETP